MYILIPTILTFNKLSQAATDIVNAVHTSLGLPTVTVGSSNPYYLDLMDLVAGGAPFTRDKTPGIAECGPIINTAYITLQQINLICAVGGDITGLQVFFELDSLDTVCPFGDGVETWATWGVSQGNAPANQINGKWYKASNAGVTGEPLKASQWINYYRGGGKVILKTEYIEKLNENT